MRWLVVSETLDNAWEVFRDYVVVPLFEDDDDSSTLHRKRIFGLASFIVILSDLLIVIFAFSLSAESSDCGMYLGFTALAGFCLTLLFYIFCRLQQSCSDLVVTLQFFHCAVRQYLFTVLSAVPTAYAGAVGACIASLLFVACRIPPQYHVIPLMTLLAIFAMAIADVNFGVGPSNAICVESHTVLSFLVSVCVLLVFYITVVITSLSMFLVSFCGDDMKGFFALRMADVVLGLIASLDLDAAAHVLDISKQDVTPEMHHHFHRMVHKLKRYKEYLPTALFPASRWNGAASFGATRPGFDPGSIRGGGASHLPRNSDALIEMNAVGASMRPSYGSPINPLLPESVNIAGRQSSFRSLREMNSNVDGNVFMLGSESNMQPDRGLSIQQGGMMTNQNLNTNGNNNNDLISSREFATKRGTVMRISFSLHQRKETISEAAAFRKTMEDVVTAVQEMGGEIEEATSTFVLVSFGARFTIVTHEQIAADCALHVFTVLNEIYKTVYISIASGQLNVGTFSADGHAWLVIGGAPIDLVAKMNGLQEQIHCPIVLTSEAMSRSQHQFLAVDLCRPVGYEPFVVFELITSDVGNEVREDMLGALTELQCGAAGIPEAMRLLSKHEHHSQHAKRLLRVLKVLPDNVAYCKEEVPWVADLDDPLPVPPNQQKLGISGTNAGLQMAPPMLDTPFADHTVMFETTNSITGSTATKRQNINAIATNSQFGGTLGEINNPTFFEDAAGQSWQVSPEIVSRGRTSTVSLALGSLGTLAAAVAIDGVSEDMLRDVYESTFRLVSPNIARVIGIHNEDETKAPVLLTEYFPQGSMKNYMQEYGAIQPKAWVNFVKDMIRGVQYLTHNEVVHGCIRPSCLLLSEDGSCALTKYALSPPTAASPEHLFYAAPEMLTNDDTQPVTSACDIWSLGITALELLGCEHPCKQMCQRDPVKYQDLFMTGSLTQEALNEEVRRSMRGTPKPVMEFILSCLVLAKETRPSIVDVMRIADRLMLSDDREEPRAF